MPRHRVSRTRKQRVPRIPRPPKQPKDKRPSISELKVALKDLISADYGVRLAALTRAVLWYDKAVPYTMLKQNWTLANMPPEMSTALDKACKCRARAVGTTSNNEKEVSYRMALRNYEKFCTVLAPPNSELYFKQLQGAEQSLKAKQEKLEMKFTTLVTVLSKLRPVNIEGKPIAIRINAMKDPMQMDPERTTLLFSRSEARRLYKIMRRDGLLPLLTEVLEPMSRMMSMQLEKDPQDQPTGKYIIKAADQKQAIYQLMHNVIAFAKTDDAPRRLVKVPSVPSLSIGGAGAPQKPTGTQQRAHGAIPRGPKVAGYFVVGTGPAILYEKMKDEQWHDFTLLQSMISTELAGRLRKLDKIGQRALAAKGEGWHVDIEDGKARMKFDQSIPTSQQPSQQPAAQS